MSLKNNHAGTNLSYGKVIELKPKALPRKDAAPYIGVSVRTLDDLASEGKLTRYKPTGKNSTAFLVDELDDYFMSTRQGGSK